MTSEAKNEKLTPIAEENSTNQSEPTESADTTAETAVTKKPEFKITKNQAQTLPSKEKIAEILKAKKEQQKRISNRRFIIIMLKLAFLIIGVFVLLSSALSSDPNKPKNPNEPDDPTKQKEMSEKDYMKIEMEVEEFEPNKKLFASCSDEYAKAHRKGSDQCTPGTGIKEKNNCGRYYINAAEAGIITKDEITKLRNMAELGTMMLGGSLGGISICELHTSSASTEDSIVSLYNRAMKGDDVITRKLYQLYSAENMVMYRRVKQKIKMLIAKQFDIDADKLHLAAPSFFSRITNNKARSDHDEYWHSHVDTKQYRVFHYSAHIYLSDYGEDFKGGRFVFEQRDPNTDRFGLDKMYFIEPKTGLVNLFTSGHENRHRVEGVTSGVRYQLTMGFTCREEFAIPDPKMPEGMVEPNIPDDEEPEEKGGKDEL